MIYSRAIALRRNNFLIKAYTHTLNRTQSTKTRALRFAIIKEIHFFGCHVVHAPHTSLTTAYKSLCKDRRSMLMTNSNLEKVTCPYCLARIKREN